MPPELTDLEIQRFRGKISKATDCHLWTGPVNNHGYGRFEVYRAGARVRMMAHRIAYGLAEGRSLADLDGLVIRHHCDMPPCCNPDHLEAGTQRDNVLDAIGRNRADHSGLDAYREERDHSAIELLARGERRCSGCRMIKRLDEFDHNRSELGGRAYRCKACRKLKKRAV